MSITCEGEGGTGVAFCPNGQRVFGVGSTANLRETCAADRHIPFIERVSYEVYLDLANVVAVFAEFAVEGSPFMEDLCPYLQTDCICVDVDGLIVEEDDLAFASCRQLD
jgi:hypothetical protein